MKLSAFRPIALVLSRELLTTALLLLGVSFVVFIILFASPGDPFSALLDGQPSFAEARTGLRETLEARRSWHSQYVTWLAAILTGHFGASLRTGAPVLPEVLRVGGNTLILTIGSMLVTLLIAVPIALYTAVRGGNKLSWSLTLFSYVVSAVPMFWLGYLVIYYFTHELGLFPIAFGYSGGEQKLRWLYQLLPILVLGVGNGSLSEVIRYLRDELARVMAEDYIRTARAKGAPVWKHSFKEGLLIPVTEIVASKIPFLLGGAVIVEQVFNWPGMGRMAWQAAQDRDYPVIMGIAVLAAALVRLGSLLRSVVYVAVNPRASKQ